MIKKFFKLPITNYQLLITNKGLTLLEMAISMAILAIALVALANLFPIGLKLSRRASTFSEASILAQRVLENIKTAASIYDEGTIVLYVCYGDNGIGITGPCCSDHDSIGYFELVNQDQNAWSFYDNDLEAPQVGDVQTDAVTGYTTYRYRYKDTDMQVYVKSIDWDANGNNLTGWADGDLDDVLLSQKVYVAIYWTEADRDRAETFITYIANPFYEKYR